MTDRPDPFDDLEFETAEPIEPEAVEAVITPPAPAAEAAPLPAPAAAAVPASAPAAEAEPVKPAKGPSPVLAWATLGVSGMAFAGTIAAVIVTVAASAPKPSPERATLGRIEALLGGQREALAKLAEAPAPAAPTGDADAVAALTAVVRANQEAIARLPSEMSQQIARIPRQAASAPARPVVITRPAPAASGPGVAEVLRTQAAIQRQLDALTAKMAKTAAICAAQNDGQIRYP
jgi:hypothetical protein